jgi:hypothetical protein
VLKLNKLLYLSTERPVFSDEIEPAPEQRKELVAAKNAIRDHLRPRIAHATATLLGMPKQVEPRFRTQGSWSYKTCVQQPSMPPQQMDWDFGVYLPVDVWEDNGPPHAMAKAYFELVETLLSNLCREKNWTLLKDKSTCIRVQIADWAHIDVPLYAAPALQFVNIVEKAEARARRVTSSVHDSIALDESVASGELPEQVWEDLDDIMLATRSGEWMPSDPEAISRWFNDRALTHEQLRRICRYAKAWRDLWWPDGGGPSSVALMIAIAQNFVAHPGRDDLAFEKSMRQLASALTKEIREPGIDNGKENFNRLTPHEQADAASKASDCANAFQRARTRGVHQKEVAIADVEGQLGQRVPRDQSLVEIEAEVEAVLAVKPRVVVPPVVRATSAG